MANLTEIAQWENGIYRIETTDPVLGGENGISNAAAKQLANRTSYLKQLVDAINGNYATQAYVAAQLAALVDSSPAALDTLNELAAALGDDPNFAATMTAALAGKQPLDATLTALAALVTSADKMVYSTGPDAFALTTITAFARSVLSAVDAAAMRTTLGLAYASVAQTQAGLDGDKSVTPSGLAATMLGGLGQTRQNVTGSRAPSTVYTNSTGRPIVLILSINVGAGQSSTLTVGSHVINIGNAATVTTTIVREVLVLPGETYSLSLSGSSISSWWEIR